MDGILKDARFAHIPRDPAFKRIPKQERKVKIDKRFQSMFSDKKFQVKYTVDKRGRPVRNSTTENLRRYYDLESSDESEDSSNEASDDLDSKGKTNTVAKLKTNKNRGSDREQLDDESDLNVTYDKSRKLKKRGGRETDSKKKSSHKLNSSNNVLLEVNSDEDFEETGEENSGSDFDGDGNDNLDSDYQSLDEKVRTRLQDMSVDYARGEGIILSDSSSDEESSNDEEAEDEEDAIGWGQLDQDAERTDESTNRLAVCNMDWDRITAKDLLVLLHSFVPKGGLIHSVTIYPSEFGLQRLKEEEEKGPLELRAEGEKTVTDSDTDEDEKEKKKKIYRDDEEEEEGSEYQREKLRQYQLKRLRYYYAVVVCDSVSTADSLYKECDGMEYESSASHLDLRFIPDGTTFDQKPKEMCTELPNMAKYEPQQFVTTALQQSKVSLTWDETDPRRSKINEKINAGKVEEVDDNDLKAYLATSSSEGESSEEEEDKKESASKYRALLESIESQETVKKEKNMEMEVTWGFGLNEKVKKKLKDGKMEEMTPFQKYLERRKEKRKAKREEQLKKKKQQQRESADENEEDSASEDDVPSDIDMNDEYFKEEFEKEEFVKAEKAKSKKKNKKKKDGHESEDEESKKKKAELELLLMDEEDNKKHFNLKDILIEDSEGKKKKKKKNKKKLEDETAEKKVDDFQINLQDNRFSAVFTSHLYNIDPADPHYKKTKAMEALRQEKLNRRTLDEELPSKKQKMETPEKKKHTELSLLVKNVKRKTQTLKK